MSSQDPAFPSGTTGGETTGPESGASEPAASGSLCPVERLVRRFACSAPRDAADRLLAGLTPERVTGELYRAEVARLAAKVLWPSIFLAVFGLATLVGSVVHRRPRWSHAPRSGSSHEQRAPLELADASATTLEVEAEKLALPFTLAPRGN